VRASDSKLGAATTRALLLAVTAALVTPACSAGRYRQASCRGLSKQSIFVLKTQTVPSTTYVPCVLRLPKGWSYGGSDVRSGTAQFWLNSDRAGHHAAQVTLTRDCDVSGAALANVPTPPGLVRYDEPSSTPPLSTSYFVFPGGCITYRLSFTERSAPSIFRQDDGMLGFTPRSVYVDDIRKRVGVSLCGAGAPPCPG